MKEQEPKAPIKYKLPRERLVELKTIEKETGISIPVLIDFSISNYVRAYQERKRRDEKFKQIQDAKREAWSDKFDDMIDDDEDLDKYMEPYRNDPFEEDF